MTYSFVNPYNFIPLDNNAVKPVNREGKKYTGVIEYSLVTKTPLSIPNTSNDNAFQMTCYDRETKKPVTPDMKTGELDKHKSYDFFSYVDLSLEDNKKTIGKINYRPIIPGSEARGMVRSNYEILTNSCMAFMDSDVTMGKRTHQNFQAGLIVKNGEGGYDLHEAEDCLFRSKASNLLTDDAWADNASHWKIKSYVQKDLKEGQKVGFTKINRGKHIKSLATEINISVEGSEAIGYAIKGVDGPVMTQEKLKQQKHCCHIFFDKNKTIERDVSLKILKSVLKTYESNGQSDYKEYGEELKKFEELEEKDKFPVYYDVINTETTHIVFLSPACITREIYQRKLAKMVGKHNKCTDRNCLCPACSLFGILDSNSGLSVTSRIRFSDLQINQGEESDCYLKPITLKPLAAPKLNNMEFYLEKPADDAVFWTYDYYIDKKGNIHLNNKGINGRKFYWHQMNIDPETVKDELPTNLNVTVHPVKAGCTFKGKLYFQNITKTELDTLIYILRCGDEAALKDKAHGYKIGGAKPLGFGSIAVDVDAVLLREINKDSVSKSISRSTEPYDKYEDPQINPTTQKNFSKMTEFSAVQGMNVDYPRKGKDGDIFEWFSKENHKAYPRPNGKPNNSPNLRTQEYYNSYMEPMNPILMSTGVDLGKNNNYNERNTNYSRSLNQRNNTADRNHNGNLNNNISENIIPSYKGFKLNEPVNGVVVGHNNRYIIVKTINAEIKVHISKISPRVSLRKGEELAHAIPVNTNVLLTYKGMDGQYPNWDCVRLTKR